MTIRHYGPHRAPEAAAAVPWVEEAACATVDPELMFPAVGDKPAYRTARTLCAVCPVVGQCLEEAMALEGTTGKNSRHGVRGGMSPAERADLSRQRRRDQLEDAA